MGISVNGPSGIDTQYIIDSLVEIERTKITAVERQKESYQSKITAYSKFKTLLTDLQGSAHKLAELSSFDLFSTKSTDDSVVTVSAGTGSIDATYDMRVFQLASNEKMISADGLISDQAATLESLGISVGTISINDTEITIDSSDTLQDMRAKINNATDEDGNRLGVSASVLKISEDNYRLVLTAKESGSDGVGYKDISGSTLQNLGIIQTADGEKGITNQTLTSDNDIQSAWAALADGESVQITGTDGAGNAVRATIIKHADDTDDDFLAAVDNAFNGMVDASFGVTGELEITDRVGGISHLSIDEMTVGASTETFSIAYGDIDSGVLTVGKDAFFSVDNIFMSSSDNSASGFVSGVTFDFHGVSDTSESTVTIERDSEAIREKFQAMVNSYNAILRFANSETKIADPTKEDGSSGNLAGDSTVRSIASQLNNFFHQQFDILDGDYKSFIMLGLKTDTTSGELKIDNEAFDTALEERFDEVVNMFVTVGTSDNNGIVLGTSSEDTESGKYIFEEVDAQHFRAQRDGDTTWYTSEARMGDIISFEEGPLKGLSVTAASGVIGGGSATFTLSKGLSTIIDEAITNLTDSHEGLVALRTESYNRSISHAEDKIMQLEERLENYRLRLVNQFSAMEQALSQLQAQSANMLSTLVTSNSNQ